MYIAVHGLLSADPYEAQVSQHLYEWQLLMLKWLYWKRRNPHKLDLKNVFLFSNEYHVYEEKMINFYNLSLILCFAYELPCL